MEINDSSDIYNEAKPKNKNLIYHQMFSSCFGAFLTSISMTPFDVVKNRMQSGFIANANETILVCAHEIFRHFYRCKINRFSAMISISRNEGISSLWRGLSLSLTLTLPQTAIYFIMYENLKVGLVANVLSDRYSPAISGIIARSIAVTITNPIELLRTRVQAGNHGLKAVYLDIHRMIKTDGISCLGKGLSASLLRDAPFSAIYWSFLELFKNRARIVLPNRTYKQDLGISFISGSVSGIIAATLTHPFDVIKTVLQVSSNQSDKQSALRKIYAENGLRGFWIGLFPRIAKAAPACGIMISSYELGKRYLGEIP